MNAFQDVDFILTPSTPSTAFKVGEKLMTPLHVSVRQLYPTSKPRRLPSISLPAGFHDNLPIGMQLIGDYFKADLLQASHAFQSETNWHQLKPNLAHEESN